MSDAAPSAPVPAEEAKEASDRIPEDDEILDRWMEFVEKVSEGRPKLKVALAAARLRLSEEAGFKLLTFDVLNVAQKGWIEEKVLRDLEKQYNSFLSTNKLHLAVDVLPVEEVETKIYMPEEKAQDLMEKNPEVRKLVKDLALDTK